jgi:ribonuclease HI
MRQFQEDVVNDIVIMFVDGACSGNPGPGGWAALIGTIGDNGKVERMVSGCYADTTNNQMELAAVLGGLQALEKPSTVTVVTDSANVIGWLTGAFKIKNERIREICDMIFGEIQKGGHRVIFEKVLGHSGNRWNEKVDREAQRQARIAKTILLPEFEVSPSEY